MELLKLQKYNEHRQETGENTRPYGSPHLWKWQRHPRFRCGIASSSAFVESMIWIFLGPGQFNLAMSSHNPSTNHERAPQAAIVNVPNPPRRSNRRGIASTTRADGRGAGRIDLYSLEKERELGRQLARDVEAQSH